MPTIKTNLRISKWLCWLGVMILSLGLTHYFLGTGNDWLLEWGAGTMLAGMCYHTSTWTEEHDRILRIFIVIPSSEENNLENNLHLVCTTTKQGEIGDIYGAGEYETHDGFLTLAEARSFCKTTFGTDDVVII